MGIHVLVTGSAGSGKTHMARYFRRRGVNAYDADSVAGLARWVDKDGEETIYDQSVPDSEWFAKNWWEWDVRVLRRMLSANKTLFLFGDANNSEKISMLFDRVYFLHADGKLISKRLKKKSRVNLFGKDRQQRKMILGWIPSVDKKARDNGFIFVDASLPPRKIFDIVYGKP